MISYLVAKSSLTRTEILSIQWHELLIIYKEIQEIENEKLKGILGITE